MKIAARATAAQPFYAMSIGERAGILQAEGHSIAKLSLGEPDFGAPPAVREEMCRIMDGRPLPYSPALGLLALREAIAGFYRDRHGVEVDPARIVVTTGASSALLLVAAATTQAGDDVVIADPSYPCNRQLVETYGGRIVLAPTSSASRYQMDRAAAEAAWTPQTSAVMLATPSNPTGTSIPFEELASICELARERSAWRIVDEIYLGLADPGEDGRPARTVLETDPDAIVINSFSKYFGMTGWRLGWAILPEELVAPAENLAVNYFLCASTPVQQAALAAFSPESIPCASNADKSSSPAGASCSTGCNASAFRSRSCPTAPSTSTSTSPPRVLTPRPSVTAPWRRRMWRSLRDRTSPRPRPAPTFDCPTRPPATSCTKE